MIELSRSAFGDAILPLLFPKERVPASPPSPDAQAAGTTCSESAAMAVSLLTLMVLIVAFGAEVGWLCRC